MSKAIYNYHVLYGSKYKTQFKTYKEAKQYIDSKNKGLDFKWWNIVDVSKASKAFKLGK